MNHLPVSFGVRMGEMLKMNSAKSSACRMYAKVGCVVRPWKRKTKTRIMALLSTARPT